MTNYKHKETTNKLNQNNGKANNKTKPKYYSMIQINPLNAVLNTICHLLALLGAHHILHISRIRV